MVIFIDIDNTLLDFNKCSAQSIAFAAKDYGIALPDDYFVTFKRINDGLWHSIERKELTLEGLKRTRFNIIFGEMGIDFDGPVFETRFRSYLTESAVPVDGAREILEYLSGKYDVYAASNAPRNQQAVRLEKAGMLRYLKGIYISEEIGAAKPSAEFFTRCFAKIGITSPADAVMIGDSVTADIAGAKDFGMRTILFNFDGIDRSGCPADYVVNTLDEIKNIL